MPAHRSEAEEAIRAPVIKALRRMRPNARIMQEVNIDNGRNRVDVMAVDFAEIIMVEIKSERDKLDRLPVQLDAMRRSAHHVIAALHRKFMPDEETEKWLSRPRLDDAPHDVLHWWAPGAQDFAEAHHPAFVWEEPNLEKSIQATLPHDALKLLHRDELARVCARSGIAIPPRANMMAMERGLRWGATGREITIGICRELRRRTWAAESDPAIHEDTP